MDKTIEQLIDLQSDSVKVDVTDTYRTTVEVH